MPHLLYDNLTRIYLDASFKGVKRLFVLAFDNTTTVGNNNTIYDGPDRVKKDSHTKYFLPRVNLTNYNVLLMAETFMINQLMIKFKSMMKLERLQ